MQWILQHKNACACLVALKGVETMKFNVDPPLYVSEGVMHFSTGKFVLPISAVETIKRITKRKRKIVAITAILAALVLLIGATVLAYEDKSVMPYRQELLNFTGKPLSAVIEGLDLKDNQPLQMENGTYQIQSAGKVKNMDFDILLRFDENEGLLCGFGYEASCNLSSGQASRNISRIAKMLSVDELIGVDGTVIDAEKNDILALLEKSDIVEFSQTIQPLPGYSVLEGYIQHLENAEYYEGNVAGYTTKHAIYYEDLTISYDCKNECLNISLWSSVEADRSK